MEVIIIEKKDWQELSERLSRIEHALSLISQRPNEHQKQGWIPLLEFLKYSTISRATWYRTYQHRIKHRNDGIKIWVNIPSFEKYLEEKAINK